MQEPIPVTQLVRETAAVMQEFTQSGYAYHVFIFKTILKPFMQRYPYEDLICACILNFYFFLFCNVVITYHDDDCHL